MTKSFAALAACLLAVPGVTGAQGFYARLDGGFADSQSARFGDANCSNSTPPALFGCGAGRDGAPLGASGDFSSARHLEIGVGYRVTPNWRGDFTIAQQRGYGFTGNANFLNTSGAQDVRSEVNVKTAMFNAYFDFPTSSAVTPYLGVGAGWAEKNSSEMRYTFPGISATAATVTPGGARSDVAWRATLGVGITLAPHLALDISAWYADLGKVESPAGRATIVRNSGSRFIDIDSASATLRAQGLNIGLRYSFGQ